MNPRVKRLTAGISAFFILLIAEVLEMPKGSELLPTVESLLSIPLIIWFKCIGAFFMVYVNWSEPLNKEQLK